MRWGFFLGVVFATHCFAAEPTRIQWASLHSVHGLWGGVNVYVNEEGFVFAQVVGRSRGEQRYSGQIKPANIPEFERLLEETDFANITFPEHRPIPDEGRTLVRILPKSGTQVLVEKWDRVRNDGFTRVYNWFMQRVETLKTHTPEFEGTYDPNWRPEGYK